MADEFVDDAPEPDQRPRPNQMERPHEHASAAGASGAGGPGDAGYEGEVTIGEEGGAAGPESFQDPFGRPDSGDPPPHSG